jgi:hypothetical protein
VRTIAIENPQGRCFRVVATGDESAPSQYQAESYHAPDVVALEQPGLVFYVARQHGIALGTAAIVDRRDRSAVIKRMLVSDAARGLGMYGGRQHLDALTQ